MIAFALPLALACAACVGMVTDGDTLKIDGERIRLLGIDAPELPGHCRKGRDCAPGDPVASADNLERLIRNGPIRIVRFGQDRYGRTLAIVYAGETNLNCAQIEDGQAIYVARWDNGKALAKVCAAAG